MVLSYRAGNDSVLSCSCISEAVAHDTLRRILCVSAWRLNTALAASARDSAVAYLNHQVVITPHVVRCRLVVAGKVSLL